MKASVQQMHQDRKTAKHPGPALTRPPSRFNAVGGRTLFDPASNARMRAQDEQAFLRERKKKMMGPRHGFPGS